MNKDESLIEHIRDRPGHDVRYSLDSSKIRSELSWKPKHRFDDALRKTVKWYEENKKWWKPIATNKVLSKEPWNDESVVPLSINGNTRILHGGKVTRLKPLTYAGPKQLIPVANKPVSQYALEDLVSSGVKDVAIVLGETFPDMVRDYYGDGSRFNVRITYVYQGKALGISYAVGLCRAFVGDGDFIVYLGDNMFQNGIKKYVEYFDKNDPNALVLQINEQKSSDL